MNKANIEPIIEYINSLDERPSQAAVARHMKCTSRNAALAFRASKHYYDRDEEKRIKIERVVDYILNSEHRPTIRDLTSEFKIGQRTARELLTEHAKEIREKRTKFQIVSDYIDRCEERPSLDHLLSVFDDVSDSYINLALRLSRFSGRKTKRVIQEKREARQNKQDRHSQEVTVINDLMCGDLSMRMMSQPW